MERAEAPLALAVLAQRDASGFYQGHQINALLDGVYLFLIDHYEPPYVIAPHNTHTDLTRHAYHVNIKYMRYTKEVLTNRHYGYSVKKGGVDYVSWKQDKTVTPGKELVAG